jgi:predicted nucleic acid-binding protein
MTFVIDASVALKWFIEEDGSAEATAFLNATDSLIAPDLIVVEVCNAAWKALRSGTISGEQQDYAASRLPELFDELVPLATLAPRAVAISRALDHPVYDCFHLALAEQRGAALITADRRLLRRLHGTELATHAQDLRAPINP